MFFHCLRQSLAVPPYRPQNDITGEMTAEKCRDTHPKMAPHESDDLTILQSSSIICDRALNPTLFQHFFQFPVADPVLAVPTHFP
jgi:hypothetical protein